MSTGNRLFIILVTLCSCIGWDQATKIFATRLLRDHAPQYYFANSLRLEYAENVGAFLGLGSSLSDPSRWFLLSVVAGALLLGLTLFIYLKHDLTAAETIGYGLILAGGGSNVLNRIVSGFVVDFLNVGIGGLRTGIFNVADVSIMIGFTLVTWCRWARQRQTAVVST